MVCGATGYALSCGGPSICPSCDCGAPAFRMPAYSALVAESARLRAVNAELADAQCELGAANVALAQALAELVACKDLKDAWLTTRSDPYYITEAGHMEAEYERRKPAAWEAARAALSLVGTK